MSSYTHLVIVCGHAIFLGHPSSPACDAYALDQWLLKPFQQPTPHKPAEHETFIQHIRAGLDNLLHGSSKHSCLLVFSGGPTEPGVTPLSEAQSYMNAATALSKSNPLGQPCVDCLKPRILLEENATDSYQNLLFSIMLFRRATGRYPETIRVITDAFKTSRFLSLHATAIHWPKNRILIQGIDPVMPEHEYTQTVAGESSQGQALWTRDWYGTKTQLAAKRSQRGWHDALAEKLGDGLEDGVVALLRYDGGEDGVTPFPGALPWARRAEGSWVEETVANDSSRGQALWTRDWYGTKSQLAAKRSQRGWHDALAEKLGDGLEDGVVALSRYDGGEDGVTPFPGALPWAS